MTTPVSYVDVATVMSSTANGTVVPSAYGDQVRDNVVAVWYGWWFKALRSTNQLAIPTTWTLIIPPTFNTAYDSAVTASADGMATLSSGYMVLNRAGTWLFSAEIASGSGAVAASISVGTATGLNNSASDYHQEGAAGSVAAPFKVVTLPTYVSLWAYNGTVGNANMTGRLEGYWLGDA
jgi:hypothetical protein